MAYTSMKKVINSTDVIDLQERIKKMRDKSFKSEFGYSRPEFLEDGPKTPRIYRGEDGRDYVDMKEVGLTEKDKRDRFEEQIEKYGMSRYLPENFTGGRNDGMNPWKFLGASSKSLVDLVEMALEKNLVLFGPAGTGKTTLAVTVADAIQKKQKNVQVRRWNDWLSQMRDFFRAGQDTKQKSDGYYNQINKAIECDLLLIDELADTKQDKVTSFVSQTLFDVVSGRYGNTKPTIFTSNLNRDELAHLYGYPCASRIFDRSLGVILDFQGEDRWR